MPHHGHRPGARQRRRVAAGVAAGLFVGLGLFQFGGQREMSLFGQRLDAEKRRIEVASVRRRELPDADDEWAAEASEFATLGELICELHCDAAAE